MYKRTKEDWLPRSERRPVSMRAFAVRRARETAEVEVSDLSYEGCGIRTSEMFKRGERVELRVARLGIIQAEVRWSGHERAGLRFAA